jgi:hypothetical protein
MSLTKLSLGGKYDVIYKLFLSRESLVSDIPEETGISKTLCNITKGVLRNACLCEITDILDKTLELLVFLKFQNIIFIFSRQNWFHTIFDIFRNQSEEILREKRVTRVCPNFVNDTTN